MADATITIEQLHVLFDAARERDEAYLEERIHSCIARHASARAAEEAAARRAARERAVGDGRSWP